MGQGYHFHQGEVTFTSRYYDTDHVALWKYYGENMNYTSVWWGTVYATQNLTAKDHFSGWHEDGLEHTGSVPAVSWWKVGKDVLGMSEWPSGVIVDPHTMDWSTRGPCPRCPGGKSGRMFWECQNGQVALSWILTQWNRSKTTSTRTRRTETSLVKALAVGTARLTS